MLLQEHIHRRKKLLNKMQASSAALIFAAPKIPYDIHHNAIYHQNSNFWYFTGFNEPNALLVLLKDHDCNHKSIIFNQEHNKNITIWEGQCLGQNKVIDMLGIDHAISWNEVDSKLYLLLNNLNVIYHAQGEYIFADKLLFNALKKLRLNLYKNEILRAPTMLIDWRPLVYYMRLFKSKKEIKTISHACKITALAHNYVMQKCKLNMYEYQLEGIMRNIFNSYEIQFPSYPIIIGSGTNACILHYTKNSSIMQNGNLVLVDAGCRYLGYASDVTRTFPVNGKFSPEQTKLYNIVLKMLKYALKFIVPGCNIRKINEQVIYIMVNNLIKIGLIKGEINKIIAEKLYSKFFMHSLSHWLGLDVHDVGDYYLSVFDTTIEADMVLSVEPGIYIPDDADVPISYRGIGIRIEDNILITNNGNQNLTDVAITCSNDIETLMSLNNIK